MQAEPALAKEILRYFLQNPHAADSLEGIASWRLMEELIHQRVEVTQKALEWLVSRGFLRDFPTTIAGHIFSLNRAHRSDAEAFLAEETPHTAPRGE